MRLPKILLVDPSEVFLELAKRHLREKDAVVHTSTSGHGAIRSVRKIRPNLVFLSLDLGEEDGRKICANLKADGSLSDIPVVMVVARSGAETARSCLEVGAAAVIAKPLERKTLLDTCRRFINRTERRSERIPCRATSVYRWDDRTCYGTIEDLGEHGMFVGGAEVPKVGKTVRISFILPGSQNVVRGTGRVAWENRSPRRKKPDLPEGFGLEFVDLDADGGEEIRRYLEYAELRHRHLLEGFR